MTIAELRALRHALCGEIVRALYGKTYRPWEATRLYTIIQAIDEQVHDE
jgi:hypothetical protein